ncbi:Ms4533A family Cys-rich leader peptide [Nocardia alni]|uniref:Ms4533A family Cys-rich leader peptide n=1 Tax=Nocardia alni TaxID=2815723 RepID=UPI0034D6EA9F
MRPVRRLPATSHGIARRWCHLSPRILGRSRWFIPLCYSLPVSSSVVPQVRHELALIAVGCLVIADVYCRR